MDISDIPAIPEELLAALERRFPEKSADKDDRIEKLMWEGGERNVVRTLRRWFEEQNGHILEPQVSVHVQS